MSKEFKPWIPAEKNIPEFTFGPLLVGVILGVIFGASSLYLVLKVGMTVTASIPVAVLSVTIFRGFTKLFGLRPRTILENNVVTTTGSGGESIAFGVGVTMPAVLILGFDMETSTVMLVAVLGSLLGVLMMIPLRRVLMVQEHGKLIFPEGTAAAEVLKAGETGGTSAKTILGGFVFGSLFKLLNIVFHLWRETASAIISFPKGAVMALEASPELLGVGYIIGPRLAGIMFAGNVLAYWMLAPMIKLFGEQLTTPLFPAAKTISAMTGVEIWRAYVLYIGVGMLVTGGLISLCRNLPMIVRGAMSGFTNLSQARKGAGKSAGVERTDRDLPMSIVIGGSLLLVLTIWLAPGLHMNLLGAILILAFGFLFVTVSSRLVGEIGSSTNPISGMTVATLLVTSLVFLALGWVEPQYRLIALCVAGIVCVAAANGGITSQDLKTGHLIGATPKYQQICLLIGGFSSAMVIGFALKALNDASTVYSQKTFPPGLVYEKVTDLKKIPSPNTDDVPAGDYRVLWVPDTAREGVLAKLNPGKYLLAESGEVKYFVDPGINGALTQKDDGTQVQKYIAPKAALMSLIIDGILSRKLPWGLVLLGVALSIVMELSGVAALPFAVGVYLPAHVSSAVFVGGVVRWIVNHIRRRKGVNTEEEDSGPGVLYSSGLIAGGAIAGILIAFATGFASNFMKKLNIGHTELWKPIAESPVAMVVIFGALAISLGYVALSGKDSVKTDKK